MKKIIFVALMITSFFFTTDVFALNEDYLENLTYDKYSSYYYHKQYPDSSNFTGTDLTFSKVSSIHSIEGPFYSFSYDKSPGNYNWYSEFFTFDLTKDLHSMFDTSLLVEYDRSYYWELLYYTKDINLTNLQDGELNAPSNYSFITNDFQTLYDNYEVLDADRELLQNDFRQTTILDSYVTYGRTQCQKVDIDSTLYKCRITYQVDPNQFHISADNPYEEARGAKLVFRFDDFNYEYGYEAAFVAIDDIGLNSELAGTDDMIPEDEDLPPVGGNNSDDDSGGILETIRNIFDTIINLPLRIAEEIGKFFDWLGQLLTDLFSPLAKNIGNAIHDLFVPGDELEGFFEEEYEYLKQQLGFLTYPIEVVVNFANRFYSLDNSTSAIFKIPKLEIFNYTLYEGTDFDLMSLVNNNDNINFIYNIYRTFVSGLIVLWLVQLAVKKEHEIFGGGTNC